MCVCARVPLIANKTKVLVLQHPRERTHAIGTARLARLGLSNSHVEVAWNAAEREDEPPEWLPSGTALLYPSPEARSLETMPADERPTSLLVIDGTWHTAHTLFRDKSWLQRLPQVKLSPSAPSNYRLRREPRVDFVSTIEAIVQALQLLEPETEGLPGLLQAFDAMIDDQLAHVQRKAGARRLLEKRPLAQRRTPRALIERFDNMVITYVESHRRDESSPREIVQVCAYALRSDEAFERIVKPRDSLPGAGLLYHMGLPASLFETALTQAELRDDFEAFLLRAGRNSMLAAWNQGSLDLLAALLGQKPSKLALKSAYRSVYGADVTELEDAVLKRALPVEPNAFRGRASRRFAHAFAVARHLHARALGEG
jgi:DTW domain-containing protein YfiP